LVRVALGRNTKLDAVPYYREIRDAFGQPGCPFCRLLDRSANRYLDAILWEMVNAPDVRDELNRALGYCSRHGWLLVRAGAALGIAILTKDLLRTLLDLLAEHPLEATSESAWRSWLRSREGEPVSGATAGLVEALSPQLPCPVCAHLQSLEKEYANTLLAHLEGPGALAEVYRTSDGLCLEHFCQTLARASGKKAGPLVVAQEAAWQRLHAELGEFIRKSDHRFRHEGFGPERDAWRRALEAISGSPPPSGSSRQSLTQSV